MFERSTMDNKVNKLGETPLSEKENLTTGQKSESIVIKEDNDTKIQKKEEMMEHNIKKKGEETVVMVKQSSEATKEIAEKEVKQKPNLENKSNFMLTLGVAVLAGISLILSGLSYQKVSTPITFPNSGTDGNMAQFAENSIAEVANKVSGSVVSIVTKTKAMDFFGQNHDTSAAGTGIIVSSDGYILTNKHVIDGATTVNVVLDDGTVYEKVSVVAIDPLNDVAFLKIEGAENLSSAKLGDSKTLTTGQQVIAIGNALGQYKNTVTSGIISGTQRSITATNGGTMTENLTDMIQTDAAINSGNSGGPLVNASGEVIGINTATSSGADGIGFAIPISSVKGMLNSLLETGEAKRAYIGVYYVNISADMAKAYNLPVKMGAYIYSPTNYSAIVAGGPADKAGLKDKDIITTINGVKVGAVGTVASILGEYKPGDTVQLAVLRAGKEIAINITLGEYIKQ